MNDISLTEVAAHCKQAINMALNRDGETSYTLAFDVVASETALNFIYYSPSALTLNEELYNKLTAIISTNVYPYFTVFPQATPLLIPWETDDIHKARAWAFPWKRGVSKRLVINDLNDFLNKNTVNSKRIWFMPNFYIDLDRLTSITVMGLSGSGKTRQLRYLNSVAAKLGKVITIDPKSSKDLVWWAKDHAQEIIYPTPETSKSDFLSKVNDRLSAVLQEIFKRQQKFLKSRENINFHFSPIFITIDELSSLTLGVNKAIVNSFFNLLESITLLGRETNIHLILASQTLDVKTLPSAVRSQSNLRILLGQVNSKSGQYLFPDYDLSSVVVPQGVGTGIIQKLDSNDVPAITPYLAPTVKQRKENAK